MDEKKLVLASSIRRDMDAIAGIYQRLERHLPAETWDDDQLIISAYFANNLYGAFENVFQNVAAVFENSVDDLGRWHTQLLDRMRLDVMPLRPALIDDAMFDALDELRRFRHVFRHAYAVTLDAARLKLVIDKAMVLRDLYPARLNKFLEFLSGADD